MEIFKMKLNRSSRLYLTLAAMFLAASGILAASAFEGMVTFDVTRSGVKSTMTFSIKGDQTRVDIPAADNHPGTSVIMDRTSGKSTILIAQMKRYMEHDAAATDTNAAHALPPPRNTGKTETILGHVCEIWEVSAKDSGISRLWLASDLQAYFAMVGGPATKGGESTSAKFMREHKKFPLRIVEIKAGAEVSRMEVAKIEPMSIDDAVFVVPADYSKMDLHGMH